jgi:putative Mn2+ efflux pump MntP
MDKFWALAAIVFVAELPCLLRTFALQVQNRSIWSVVLATTLGNALALVVGLLLAKAFMAASPEASHDYAKAIAGAVLMGLGAYMIFSK